MKKVEKLLRIEFNGKPVNGDNDKYIRTKIKICGGNVNKNFQGKKMSKEKAPCKSLSMIMLESAVKAKKKYYPQALLEECKYELKMIKMENLIDDDLEKSSSDESDNDSIDEKTSDNEKDNDAPNE